MFYDTHVTTRAEREKLVADGNFEWIRVDPRWVSPLHPPAGPITPAQPRGKSVVWREDTGAWDELYFQFVIDSLGDPKAYEVAMAAHMTEAELCTRSNRIHETYQSMLRQGFDHKAGEFGGVCVEQTGERIDGSYRCAIAQQIGTHAITVKQYRWRWQDITKDLLGRKLHADALSTGPDYYALDFGNGLKNYIEPSPDNLYSNTYKALELTKLTEWDGKRVLDLGCNAGYMSCLLAALGADVTGVDLALTASANLCKLVCEYKNQRDLPVTFIEDDIRNASGRYDVVVCLCTHYHLSHHEQELFVRRLTKMAPVVILQGNLAKSGDAAFVNVDADGMVRLLDGMKTEVRQWRDKPFVVGYR